MTWTGCIAARVTSDVRNLAGLWLDAVIPTVVFILLASATARPIFSGLLSLTLGVGYGFANRSKQRVLGEPIVFTDIYLAPDVFRYPRMALPFPKLGPIVGGALGIVVLLALLLAMESPSWHLSIYQPLLAGIALYGLSRAESTFLRPLLARRLYAMKPSGEATLDTKIFGPFGLLLAHGLLASVERESRRESIARQYATTKKLDKVPNPGHVVLVQSESFFDPRRIKGIDAGLLPNWDSCIAAGAQWGRLSVPSWGANTVRSEFSVLTGIDQFDIGYDRFNPYHRFAQKTVPSIASVMKERGYRTVCVHSFDKRFYARDKVLPQLGFDEFIDETAFVFPQRINGFISDADVSVLVERILGECSQPIFLFVITMENHGPWPLRCPGLEIKLTQSLNLTPDSQNAFEQYLQALKNADAMLGSIRAALEKLPVPSTLGFYGDHLPALASTFEQLHYSDRCSDYLILSTGRSAGRQIDLTTHELHLDLLKALN